MNVQLKQVFLFLLLILTSTTAWGLWSITELTVWLQLLPSQFLKASASFILVGTYRPQMQIHLNMPLCAVRWLCAWKLRGCFRMMECPDSQGLSGCSGVQSAPQLDRLHTQSIKYCLHVWKAEKRQPGKAKVELGTVMCPMECMDWVCFNQKISQSWNFISESCVC